MNTQSQVGHGVALGFKEFSGGGCDPAVTSVEVSLVAEPRGNQESPGRTVGPGGEWCITIEAASVICAVSMGMPFQLASKEQCFCRGVHTDGPRVRRSPAS